MVKDFINNDHRNEKLSKEELFKIHRELVHRHVAWLTALRYQLREDNPWGMHLKATKSNQEFRESAFRVCEEETPIEEAIKPYVSETEYHEVFNIGNKPSQLLGVQSRRLRELKELGLIEDIRHMEMTNMLKEFYTLQGKSERIKNFPYPRQFATLNYLFGYLLYYCLLVLWKVSNQ